MAVSVNAASAALHSPDHSSFPDPNYVTSLGFTGLSLPDTPIQTISLGREYTGCTHDHFQIHLRQDLYISFTQGISSRYDKILRIVLDQKFSEIWKDAALKYSGQDIMDAHNDNKDHDYANPILAYVLEELEQQLSYSLFRLNGAYELSVKFVGLPEKSAGCEKNHSPSDFLLAGDRPAASALGLVFN